MSPDLGYFLGGVEGFSHSLLGSVGFSLPVGLLALGGFHALSRLTVHYAPVFHYRVIVPFSDPRRSSIFAIILSILIGSWTHLLLDSITHANGWIALHLPVLQTLIATVHHRRIRLCHLLWYGCSFIGMAWLFLAFRGWQEDQVADPIPTPRRGHVLEAALVASLLLPIEVVHHLVRGRVGMLLVAVLCLAWAIVVALRVTSTAPDRR